MTKSDEFVLEVTKILRKQCIRSADRINAFVKFNRQVEGWFKGELLKIASDLMDKNEVIDFKPDFRMDGHSKRNIDLFFELERRRRIWIELKHWYVGSYSGGGNWKASTYLTQSTSATPTNFINKLPRGWSEVTYMMIVTTPRPATEDWDNGFKSLQAKHPQRSIKLLTRIDDFPTEFFIGILKL